jgi:Zn-dependent peptidase ImmA (M78 family)/transcriptional regulator with XRE-family HTH domain
MPDPSVEIGNRLKKARARAGKSQVDLARHLNVTQTAVSYWEAGRRLPGVDHLMLIAAYLETPLAELLPAADAPRPAGALLRAVADQVDDAELAKRLEQFIEQAAAQKAPAVELTVTAAAARDAAEQLLATAGTTHAPVDVYDLARRCGVRVVVYDFANMVDGLLVQLDDGPAIGLDESRDYEHRRRFTLAHELGHYLLKHTATFYVDFHDAGASAEQSPHYNWRNERAANEFAANLLMPADLVRKAYKRNNSVVGLAQQFQVSKPAMGFRLSSLGLRTTQVR